MAKAALKPIATPNGRKLSYTGIKHFKKSPLHYMHYLNNPQTEDTDALLLGNTVDCLLLTPDDFTDKFIVYPKFEKRSNDAKAIWECMCDYSNGKFDNPVPMLSKVDDVLTKLQGLLKDLFEESKGVPEDKVKKRKLITIEMYEVAEIMVKRLKENPQSRELIDQLTATQLELNYIHPGTKVPIKGFIDGYSEEGNFIMDLKTARSAYPEDFHRTIYNMGYHIQAYIYAYGIYLKNGRDKWPENFYWVTIDNVEPYGISVNRATKEVMELGKQETELLIKKFEICCRENLWDKDYDFHSLLGIFNVELPGYLKQKLSE